jgi:hypothetical protein
VSSLLLAPSSKEAGPKGSGPREASTDDLMAAANVLVRSRELLDTLSGKLAAADAPVGCDDTRSHCCFLIHFLIVPLVVTDIACDCHVGTPHFVFL